MSLTYLPYCVHCLRTPEKTDTVFYDYRFARPVCVTCVQENNLEPDEGE